MPRFLPSLTSIVVLAAALGMVACSVETYSVAVDSPEVKQGSLALQLDASDSEYVLRVVVQLDAQRGNACPVLADDVRLSLVSDAGRSELEVQERGGGSYGVDCAIKCRELVAFETNCAPVRAELRGAAVHALRSSASMRVVLHDATSELGAGIERAAFEPRSARIENRNVQLERADASYSFAEVAFEWSHDDREHWVSEWANNPVGSRGGDFSEFNLRYEGEPEEGARSRRHVFTVRNTADRGERTAYMGATAPVASCELAQCTGLEHVTSATISVRDR